MKFYVFEDAAGRMLSPKFFYGGVTAPIDETGCMYGEKFAAGQNLPPAGTMMVSRFVRVNPNDRDVSCGAYVVAEVQAFQLSEQVRHQALHELEVAAADRQEAERAAKAIEFNASLGIPVAFRPAQKLVKNALYESNGSGANRASVEHVELCEDLVAGRIKRKKGQLLCGAGSGSWGTSTEWGDKDTSIYRISCKRCIEIASRFTATAIA